jgi:hypothetical protein
LGDWATPRQFHQFDIFWNDVSRRRSDQLHARLVFDVRLDGGALAIGDYRITISAFQNLSFAENLSAER